jgi:hypothetical protein
MRSPFDTFGLRSPFGGRRGFNPAQLFASGEQGAWYDPSDLSTVFQDAAGTVPGTVDQPVGRILDKSGRGNHATQATSAQRPTLRQSGGLYYLDFDGVDDHLFTASFNGATSTAQTFAGVRKLNNEGTIVETLGSPITNGLILWTSNTNTSWRFNARGNRAFDANDVVAINNTPAPDTAVLAGWIDLDGGPARLRKNRGAIQESVSTTWGTGPFMSRPLYMGRRFNGTSPLSGRIYSLIVRFGSTQTEEERAQVENWVAAKTGVTL